MDRTDVSKWHFDQRIEDTYIIMLSPDGRRVVTASADRTARTQVFQRNGHFRQHPRCQPNAHESHRLFRHHLQQYHRQMRSSIRIQGELA